MFSFLRELALIKAPVCRQVSEQHFHLSLSNLPHHQSVSYASRNLEIGETILRVERPNFLPIPPPPPLLERWLKKGWEDHNIQVSVARKLIFDGSDICKEGVLELFESDTKRVRDFIEWQKTREFWVQETKRAHLAKSLFDTLYQQFTHLNRNSDTCELFIGDGLLNWQVNKVKICHPMILKKVKLNFDVEATAFSIVNTDRPPELYSPLLLGIEGIDAELLRKRHSEFQIAPQHPLSEEASSFMKVLISSISPTEGHFLDAPALNKGQKPCMWREPFLFAGKRALRYVSFIERILNRIKTQGRFSPAISSIVGMPISGASQFGKRADDAQQHNRPLFIDESEIYLSKPANKQQIEIARRFNKTGLVNVQGPPGTGKSHTIANLLGHLLAQGKRVLVTSHKEQALKVLKEKVPKTLQSLCISISQSEMGDFKDLESAVHSIVSRFSVETPEKLAKIFLKASDRRNHLTAHHKKLWARLRSAIASEYEPITCDGEEISPSDAANYLRIRQNDSSQNWMPDQLKLTASCPVLPEDLAALYASNSQISAEDELEISLSLPDPELLPTPDQLAGLIEEHNQLIARDQDELEAMTNLWTPNGGSSASLEKAATYLVDRFNQRPIVHEWQMNAIVAGRAGEKDRLPWEILCTRIECAQDIANKFALVKFLKPRIDEGQDLEEVLEIFKEICTHLDNGKKFGMFTLAFRSKWKYLINISSVNSSSPTKNRHFQALKLYVEQILARRKISELWDDCIAKRGGPAFAELGEDPESICRSYIEEINYLLNWHRDIWAPDLAELAEHGLDWTRLVSQAARYNSPIAEHLSIREIMAEKFTLVVGAEIARRREWEIESELGHYADCLMKQRGEVSRNLLDALAAKDVQKYDKWHTYLLKLLHLQPLNTWRQAFIGKIENVLPLWARALRERIPPHDKEVPPGELHLAWKWRKLDCEVQRRQKEDIGKLQQAMAYCREQLNSETLNLVDSSAWSRQLELFNKSPELLQELKGLEATFKKLKSTRQPTLKAKLKAEIQRGFPACLEAVPVWIMSISRLVETLNPEVIEFDVVIIDEASQIDLMGLIPLFMCKEVIIVGDDQQITPELVGI